MNTHCLLKNKVSFSTLALVLSFALTTPLAAAAKYTLVSDNTSNAATKEYYTLNDSELNAPKKFVSPSDFALENVETKLDQVLDLVRWIKHSQALDVPTEAYNRRAHFGSWVKEDDCQNTRAKVLIRDADGKVDFSNDNCSVDKGEWHDPYTDTVIYDAKETQIDHLVPLKNAYDSGAWKWVPQMRCNYANYMSNDFHLLTVSGRENMSKGSRGPDGYLPPNSGYVCEYIKNWLKVKLIWNLKMLPAEVTGIRSAISDYQCDLKSMLVKKSDIKSQRKLSTDPIQACENF